MLYPILPFNVFVIWLTYITKRSYNDYAIKAGEFFGQQQYDRDSDNESTSKTGINLRTCQIYFQKTGSPAYNNRVDASMQFLVVRTIFFIKNHCASLALVSANQS